MQWSLIVWINASIAALVGTLITAGVVLAAWGVVYLFSKKG